MNNPSVADIVAAGRQAYLTVAVLEEWARKATPKQREHLYGMLAAENEVTIGDHVMFANGCFVGDASHRFNDPTIPITWQGFTSKGPVRIGSNVWLGVNCVVTSGVTIGDHCVIGANSVVTTDLPDNTISAGSPAKVIKEVEFLDH